MKKENDLSGLDYLCFPIVLAIGAFCLIGYVLYQIVSFVMVIVWWFVREQKGVSL